MDFKGFIREIKIWAREDSDIKAAILVGSYARGSKGPAPISTYAF